MSITLILHGKQRRRLHLPKQRLAWVGGILFTVLALGRLALAELAAENGGAGSGADPGAAAKSTQGADEAREQLAMLAAQVGTMQGQLGRLNALGERLTEKADLDPEEFNFKELPRWAALPTMQTWKSAWVNCKIPWNTSAVSSAAAKNSCRYLNPLS